MEGVGHVNVRVATTLMNGATRGMVVVEGAKCFLHKGRSIFYRVDGVEEVPVNAIQYVVPNSGMMEVSEVTER